MSYFVSKQISSVVLGILMLSSNQSVLYDQRETKKKGGGTKEQLKSDPTHTNGVSLFAILSSRTRISCHVFPVARDRSGYLLLGWERVVGYRYRGCGLWGG